MLDGGTPLAECHVPLFLVLQMTRTVINNERLACNHLLPVQERLVHAVHQQADQIDSFLPTDHGPETMALMSRKEAEIAAIVLHGIQWNDDPLQHTTTHT